MATPYEISARIANIRLQLVSLEMTMSARLARDISDDEQWDNANEHMKSLFYKIGDALECLDPMTGADPEPCSTCGHGAHETCSCRDYDEEPHGTRDTFVPYPSEGPDDEQYNPLQD